MLILLPLLPSSFQRHHTSVVTRSSRRGIPVYNTPRVSPSFARLLFFLFHVAFRLVSLPFQVVPHIFADASLSRRVLDTASLLHYLALSLQNCLSIR